MFKSFQTRLVILFATLFVVVQALIFSSVYFATKSNLDKQVGEQLKYGGSVFSQALEVKSDSWLNEASIFSSDYGFLSTITTFDEATVNSALKNLSTRIGANLAMVISLDNEIMAQINDDPTLKFETGEFSTMVGIAEEYGEATAYIEINDNIYQFIVVPVLAPIPVAWVGIGIELDQKMLLEIKSTLPVGVDITLVESFENGDFKALKTTLDGEARAEVDEILAGPLVEDQASVDSVADYKFMAYSVPLPSSLKENLVSAVLTYSLETAYSPFIALAYLLVVLAGLGLVALILGSVTVAKSISKPLEVLTRAARLIQIGRYEKVTDIKQKDEIGQLANHFNQMVIGIRDREEQIIYQAEHDIETGLPNRKSLEKYLHILLENHKDTGQMFSVLEISIDRFEDVRNALGYETARALLKKTGIRLLRFATSENFVARLGNSNFCFILEGGNSANARRLARDICEIFEEPIVVDGFPIDTNVSVGISCCPEHAETVDHLVQRASIAALHAKESIDHIIIYNKKIDLYNPEHLSLMGDFRKSLDGGDVKFYYQPKIDLAKGHITHVEALVRWIHPERGFIPPDDFITLAEQTGQIQHLTMWGLDAAISQCRTWMSEGIDLKVAINLSAKDLSNRKLPEIVIKLLEKYEVPRAMLVLEVTENAIMQDPELALGVLNALDQHGLLLSIDDYGTGYSSMSYLKQLPVKELKIDKSFVLDLANNKEDEILVRSTIELGHNLGLKVTAEGVEDKRSMEILHELGCDLIQGFYISKALPVADLHEFLENSPYGLSKDKIKISDGTSVSAGDPVGSLVNLTQKRLSEG